MVILVGVDVETKKGKVGIVMKLEDADKLREWKLLELLQYVQNPYMYYSGTQYSGIGNI